jgi:CMP-N-acetylneuraminic acid synthetase
MTNDVTIIERPDNLKDGFNSMNKIIENDLDVISNEIILQTHSTNPFLSKKSIENAIKVYLEDDKHDSLFSVNSIQSRFYDHNKKPINHNPKILLRTQDLDPIYEENSCIYLFTKESFLKTGNRIGNNPILFETNSFESLDIDNEMDFQLAESLIKNKSE